MKSQRQLRVKEIIERQVIQTQDELTEALRQEGIDVTQATVSRDIKELMLVKVPSENGYRYAYPNDQNTMISQAKMERTFQDAVVSINTSMNLIVLKTYPGTAQAVAYVLDNARWPEIIGTVAGDDTVLIVAKDAETAPPIASRLESLL